MVLYDYQKNLSCRHLCEVINRLGFEDGVQLAFEKEIRVNGSVLDVKDMTHLVYVYDSIKKLNKLLLGE